MHYLSNEQSDNREKETWGQKDDNIKWDWEFREEHVRE